MLSNIQCHVTHYIVYISNCAEYLDKERSYKNCTIELTQAIQMADQIIEIL